MNEPIGIFGGTFDPIHIGHLIIAEQILEACSLKRTLFVPSGNPPHKDNRQITPAEIRLEMVRLAVSGNPCFAIDDLELNSGRRKSYTVETLRELKARQPGADLYWIIGSDSLLDLPDWYRPEELFQLARVVVYPRPGFPPERARPDFFRKSLVIQAPLLQISSTEIRNRIRSGKTIRYLVPEEVEKFICRHQLYRD